MNILFLFFAQEPIHGSAPNIAGQDKANPIAGQDKANPIAAILSAALLLRHSLGLQQEASAVEEAVERVIDEGYRTEDIQEEGTKEVGTREMGQRIVAALTGL